MNYLAACQVIAAHVQLSIHEFVAKWWQMFQLESSWVVLFFFLLKRRVIHVSHGSSQREQMVKLFQDPVL